MADPLAQSFEVLLRESVTEKIGFAVDELNEVGYHRTLVFLLQISSHHLIPLLKVVNKRRGGDSNQMTEYGMENKVPFTVG